MALLSVTAISALLADLATAKDHLHSDNVISHLKEYLGDSGVQLKLADGRIQKAETLAADTTSAYQSFDQAKAALAQLGENQGSWLSNWEILFAVRVTYLQCWVWSTTECLPALGLHHDGQSIA